MLFSNVCTLALCATSALAFPFKRYDNSSDTTSTITVNKYVTVTLPSTTLTLPETATSEISSALEEASYSTVTKYVTILSSTVSDGTPVVKPTTVAVESVVQEGEVLGSSTVAAAAAECTPETVTVTVTAGATSSDENVYLTSTLFITSTLSSQVPVTAEITYSDFTTTVTTYVAVTSTETYSTETVYSTVTKTSTLPSVSAATPTGAQEAASVAPTWTGKYQNDTAPVRRRNLGLSNLIF